MSDVRTSPLLFASSLFGFFLLLSHSLYNAIFNSFSMFSIYIAFLISKDDVREKRRVGKKANDTIIKQYLGSFPLFLL